MPSVCEVPGLITLALVYSEMERARILSSPTYACRTNLRGNLMQGELPPICHGRWRGASPTLSVMASSVHRRPRAACPAKLSLVFYIYLPASSSSFHLVCKSSLVGAMRQQQGQALAGTSSLPSLGYNWSWSSPRFMQ